MVKVAISEQGEYDLNRLILGMKDILSSSGILDQARGKKVLIKPNCTGKFSPEQGMTTHPAVLESLVLVLKSAKAKVVIGESSTAGTDTLEAYKKTGIMDVAHATGTKIVDLKKSSYHDTCVPNWRIFSNLPMPDEFMWADLIVSLAKMKTNYVSTISCSIKNLKGLLADSYKKEFHKRGLSESIADLYSMIRHNKPCAGVVDGIIGSELYEPKKAGFLVASLDLAACDSVCSRIMGVNPSKVMHLKIAAERYIGETDSKRIELYGNIISANPPFRNTMPGLESMADEYRIKIFDGKPCSSCTGSLYLNLKKVFEKRPDLAVSMPAIAIGQELDCGSIYAEAGNVLYYGKCASDNKPEHSNDLAHCVKGCPPVSSQFIEALEAYKRKD